MLLTIAPVTNVLQRRGPATVTHFLHRGRAADMVHPKALLALVRVLVLGIFSFYTLVEALAPRRVR